MSYRKIGQAFAPALLVLAVLSTSCTRQSGQPRSRRVAVLRFENLSGDPSIAWEGRAFSEVLATELAGSGEMEIIHSARLHGYDRVLGVRPISAPGISAESSQALAAGATELVYGTYNVHNGKLEAQLTLADAASNRTIRVIHATAPAGDVMGAATELARQLSPKLAPYTTRNPQAVAAYARAIEASDPAVLETALNVAIAADPDFAPPYRLLAEARMQHQDRAGAVATIEQALGRGNAIPPGERARLELLAADLSGNPAARQKALTNLVQVDSGDVNAWRALGDVSVARRDYRGAEQAYQRASTIEPDEPLVLNSLGYAAGQAGDMETATKALKRYAALRPNEANPLDSLGDVNFAAGKFAEAEDLYQQSLKKDPNFNNQGALLKAALAHLLTGDTSGANNIAERYFQARSEAKDQIVDYRRAEWTWISGRRKAATQQMGAFALAAEGGPMREVASRAYAELAVWSLMLGDREMGARLAQKSISIAGPTSAGNALVARFFSLPPASSSEWTVRAEQQFPGPAQTPIKNFALAYALLLNKQFQPAQLLLKEIWESGTPTADEGLPVVLAWCYLEMNRPKDAAPLLRSFPIPSSAGLSPYSGFYIPRVLYLRGLLAEQEGRKDEARSWYDKFLAVSGPDALIWGEEKKVRQQ